LPTAREQSAGTLGFCASAMMARGSSSPPVALLAAEAFVHAADALAEAAEQLRERLAVVMSFIGWMDAKAGDCLFVPEGGLHAFHNESDEPVSFLMLFVPGAPREEYFETLAEVAAGKTFTAQEWRQFCIRHDSYFVPVP
jgi:hypothetical protein